MNKIKLFLFIILIGLAGTIKAELFHDTVQVGTDSIYKVSFSNNAEIANIAFKQLDTNSASPDSLQLWTTEWDIPFQIGFIESIDSSRSSTKNITFTYSSAGQKRIGYLNLPKLNDIWIRLANLVYLSNRKVLVIIDWFER